MEPNFEVVDKKIETSCVVDPHLKCISLKDSDDEGTSWLHSQLMICILYGPLQIFLNLDLFTLDLGFLYEDDALVW